MKKSLSKKSKNLVKPFEEYDEWEVGNWADYPTLKLCYKIDDYKSKMPDISFWVKDDGVVWGYFKASDVVNISQNDITPLYSKKIVLYDFAVFAKSYAKYGLILINFLINYAKNNGYKAIEIKKISKFDFFLNFVNRHFKLEEFDDSNYILIDKPKIIPAEKHLSIYDSDNVKIEDIYFLYDLGFSVGKKVARLKLNDKESISVDRTSGKIQVPTNIEIMKDEVIFNSCTKSIICLICGMYYTNNVEKLKINFSNENPDVFEAYSGDLLYVNRDVSVLMNDIEYVSNMMNKGIKRIYQYIINYDMNDRTISNCGCREIKCEKLIKVGKN